MYIKKENIAIMIIAATVLASSLTSCAEDGVDSIDDSSSDYSVSDKNIPLASSIGTSEIASGDAVSSDYNASGKEQYITLSGSSDVKISAAGTYVLSGTLTDAQVHVEATKNDDVVLVLNGVDISNNNNSAIYVQKAKSVTVVLNDGSVNILSDGESYVFAETESDEPDSALFSKCDMTIEGTGTLWVNANYNDGIKSKDNLTISSGNIAVISVDDGIMGRDSVNISGGNFSITAGGDGIKSSNDTDTALGNINITGGSFEIAAESDCFASVNNIDISGGEFTLVAAGGSTGTTKSGEQGGFWGGMSQQTSNSSDTASAKGIKAQNTITVSGGTFNINTADDAVHSNNTIIINGGDFTIYTDDDGMHSDSVLKITDGTVDIVRSYEGIEAADITVDGGRISIVSSDDGINAAGGTDSSASTDTATQMRNFMDSFSSSTGTLTINGGYVYVYASGDGIDVNGSAVMNGGEVYVDGPTDNGNGALDYDATFTINGGTIIAAGSSGMAQSASSGSKQNTVMCYLSSTNGGTEVTVTDSSGNRVLSYTPSKTFSCIMISSSSLKTGETYKLNLNGTEYVSFTVSNTLTSVSGSGASSGGMTGGGKNGGGKQRP